MSVPETPVNHDDRSILRKNDVGLARQSAIVQPKAVASGEKSLADRYLRKRISSADGGHHSGPLLGSNFVHSYLPAAVSVHARIPKSATAGSGPALSQAQLRASDSL
jgi:hypothetical protein